VRAFRSRAQWPLEGAPLVGALAGASGLTGGRNKTPDRRVRAGAEGSGEEWVGGGGAKAARSSTPSRGKGGVRGSKGQRGKVAVAAQQDAQSRARTGAPPVAAASVPATRAAVRAPTLSRAAQLAPPLPPLLLLGQGSGERRVQRQRQGQAQGQGQGQGREERGGEGQWWCVHGGLRGCSHCDGGRGRGPAAPREGNGRGCNGGTVRGGVPGSQEP